MFERLNNTRNMHKICANGLCFKLTNAMESALPAFESDLGAEQQSDTPNQHYRHHQKLVAGVGCFCPISIRLIQRRRNLSYRCHRDFAVRLWIVKEPLTFGASSCNKFADAALDVFHYIWTLWREALVIMIMASDNDIHISIVQSLPERF
jgi:hypothetical protein